MWWRRRRIFDDIIRELEEIDEFFERVFREFERTPIEEMREPLYYGFSIRIGPEGEPEIRTFGNIKPSAGIREIGEVREPFVDVIKDEKNAEVIITAELPGVKKEDIKINATENEVEIKAESGDRRYYKRIPLDVEVDPKSAKARYNNGVLELKLRMKGEAKKGFEIKIE